MAVETASAVKRTAVKIWADLVFGSGRKTLRDVVAALCAVPEPLRAAGHCEGEDEVARPIGDVAEFLASLSSDRLTPILRAKRADYDISGTGHRPVKCLCELKVEPSLAAGFMERMAAALAPVFGFASAWGEYERRNGLDVRLRVVRVQAFVGRDLSKFVPGLYWLTLLSEALAERHGVPLAEVERAALEHAAPGAGLHLYRFHDHPGDWRARADELDALCASLPGVFNIAEVRERLVGVTEEKEFDEIVRPWR